MPIKQRMGLPVFGVLVFCVCGGVARADDPLSAINWLSQSVETPVAASAPVAEPVGKPAKETPVTKGAVPDDVTVTVLGGPSPDAIGLLPPAITGLPANLWGLGETEKIAAALTAERVDLLPTLQALFITLMLAEADAPVDSAGRGLLLQSRIDKLLDIGALDQAESLIAVTGATTPALFRRAFDVALLTGEENVACRQMKTSPNLAPTFPARIFCLARAGDWNAAALSLQTAKALNVVGPVEEQMLAYFLDPALADESGPLLKPEHPTPLVLRIYEAIGEPISTQSLPLAFAHVDLEGQAGWKAQIAAAERLARVGAITPNKLLGVYTDREPAASGGAWDRVEAFQAFDAAIIRNDAAKVTATLAPAWAGMVEAELEVPFATLYGAALSNLALEGDARRLALRVALLSPTYEAAARKFPTSGADAADLFLIGVAMGKVAGLTPPDSLARAIAPAFVDAPVPTDEAMVLLNENRFGEAVMLAIDQISRGVQGELRSVTDGLMLLRHLRLEDVARRTALELMLLERRG